jgi:hypothetical protein
MASWIEEIQILRARALLLNAAPHEFHAKTSEKKV